MAVDISRFRPRLPVARDLAPTAIRAFGRLGGDLEAHGAQQARLLGLEPTQLSTLYKWKSRPNARTSRTIRSTEFRISSGSTRRCTCCCRTTTRRTRGSIARTPLRFSAAAARSHSCCGIDARLFLSARTSTPNAARRRHGGAVPIVRLRGRRRNGSFRRAFRASEFSIVRRAGDLDGLVAIDARTNPRLRRFADSRDPFQRHRGSVRSRQSRRFALLRRPIWSLYAAHGCRLPSPRSAIIASDSWPTRTNGRRRSS